MAVVGEQFPDYVQKQIKIRQELHGKTDRKINDIVALNSKTAWVKLASGVRVKQEKIDEMGFRGGLVGIELAKKYILFGGVSSLENGVLQQRGGYETTNHGGLSDFYKGMYHVTAANETSKLENGLVPMPGIESAEVKVMNRGSIKKATVKIKAHNREQFDIIDILYLRLGYTVMLEWGNNVYIDNGGNVKNMGYTLIEDPHGFFSSENLTHHSMLRKIEGYRSSKHGNYDGLLAKVSNFNWSFNPDGSYDIELTLISMGDIIESLKTNIIPSPTTISLIKGFQLQEPTPPSDAPPLENNPTDNIISAFLYLHKIPLKEKGTDIYYNWDITYNMDGGYKGIGNWIEPIDNNMPVSISSPTYYNAVSYSFALKEAESLYSKEISEGTIKISQTIIPLGVTTGGGIYYFNIEGTINLGANTSQSDSEKAVCYFSYVIDDDSTVKENGFYMRFGHLLNFIHNSCIPLTNDRPMIDIDYEKWTNKMITYPNQISFDPRVCIVNGNFLDLETFPQLSPWKHKTDGYAWIMNIYVNFSAIESAISNNLDEEGNLALLPFLVTLCDEINKALGGVNNLEPIIDEELNTIKIIDNSFAEPRKPTEYSFETYGYNPNNNQSNFVRNLDLKTAITPEYAQMVTIGATAGGYVKGTEATMFSKWNAGIIDRYKEKISPPAGSSTPDGDEPVKALIESISDPNSIIDILGYEYIDVDMWWASPKNAPSLDDEKIDRNVALMTEYYKYLNAKAQESNKDFASKINGFIPFNLGLTTDGISGMKIYNEINVNTSFLPKNYPSTLRFIIKGVNHKLSGHDWESSIETQVIPETLDNQPSYELLEDLMKKHMGDSATLFSFTQVFNKLSDTINAPIAQIGGTTGGSFVPIEKLSPHSQQFAKANDRLTVIREGTDGVRTWGSMWYGGKFLGYTIEDAVRKTKIRGTTAIPAGNYNMTLDITGIDFIRDSSAIIIPEISKKNKVVPRVGTDKNAVELKYQGLSFEGIRIHAGTSETSSEGCIIFSRTRAADGKKLKYDEEGARGLTQFVHDNKITKITVTNEFERK